MEEAKRIASLEKENFELKEEVLSLIHISEPTRPY